MAKTQFQLDSQVRLNLKRDEEGIANSIISDWTERAQQRVADLGNFEEMENRIYDLVVEDCEDAWASAVGVACTADTTYKKRGSKSALATIDAAYTGTGATEDFAVISLIEYTHIKFWIRSNTATTAAQLDILLDNTAACASALETLSIPALVADTWTECILKFVLPSALTDIISVGLEVAVAFTDEVLVYIDDIRVIRTTAIDVDLYDAPTDNKDIISITIQDGWNSRKLFYIPSRHWDLALPRVRNLNSDVPLIYTTWGKDKFEVAPAPSAAFPMFIRYTKYPKPFFETSLVIEDCEDAWVQKANVTSTNDTAFVKLGLYSAKHVIAAGHTTGLASTEDLTAAVDVSAYTHVKLWMRTTVALAKGDVQVVLDDTGACASILEFLDIPAMQVERWYEHTLKIRTPANLTALLSVGLNVVVDGGAMTIYMDDIRVVYSSKSELLRKDQLIEAGATVYGFEYLEKKDAMTIWEGTFQGMLSDALTTNKSEEDWDPIMQGFSTSALDRYLGGTSSNPFYGR